ncbi:BZ3500_MvSof-1268-A1-R1_Chr6-3g09020 [Microbotryum saponariae]|uniref:BZ3500_MvSof-1268-A1-R1_Chr6-3g09020 protein n=1 Tax=Microbotryum saponariae TaxID=289078 RepID=A0A2X0LDG7_9BASI|nr:BZ3500_MvSof-1268-A1-R1_Chr6-3g09020 [Microbotryum saponariae]SDA07622.1 BZ3501_MvSof-1269-A2-R1_Chr6-2g08724 [Microbotryum saponariae]
MHMSLGPHRPTPKHHFRPVTITSPTPTSFTCVVTVNQSHECNPSRLFLDQLNRPSMSRLVVANISTVLAHWLSISSITPTDQLPSKTLETFRGTLLIALPLT